mmetsp:Transcript_36435/g.145556  ORF Transcript_36435/g.145556 Transcript_36435/m.145556 type:complete len:202 (+) Transcript_36435:3451-4056(+)
MPSTKESHQLTSLVLLHYDSAQPQLSQHGLSHDRYKSYPAPRSGPSTKKRCLTTNRNPETRFEIKTRPSIFYLPTLESGIFSKTLDTTAPSISLPSLLASIPTMMTSSSRVLWEKGGKFGDNRCAPCSHFLAIAYLEILGFQWNSKGFTDGLSFLEAQQLSRAICIPALNSHGLSSCLSFLRSIASSDTICMSSHDSAIAY